MSEKLELIVSQPLLKALQQIADKRGVSIEDVILLALAEFVQKEIGDIA